MDQLLRNLEMERTLFAESISKVMSFLKTKRDDLVPKLFGVAYVCC
jgi:hypothetical protein